MSVSWQYLPVISFIAIPPFFPFVFVWEINIYMYIMYILYSLYNPQIWWLVNIFPT